MSSYNEEPIAVIGMSCRFPGDARSVEDFWSFLLQGRSSVTPIPSDRFNADAHYHPSSARQGGIKVKKGHFLKEDVAAFDAPFFGMTKGEADATDPQQRLLLEVAYEAFENAGIPLPALAGSNTSVYSSCFVTDYTQISSFDSQHRSLHESTGHSSALVSNRVSWFFDLRGPSMTVDTGCSGSTVAFDLAVRSLRSGDATAALACGVNLILAPDPYIGMSAFNFVGPEGISYSFDHRANGYARGEGFAAVLLKPLSAALRDNDPIRALIRGTAVAQDGRTPGITLPSRSAQAALIRRVYARAGLDLAETAFLEAHGTGTVAGDAAELGAIGDAFADSRGRDGKGEGRGKMLVGSVKTNIGHLEGCAGLAGIVKTVLAVERGVVPGNLNFERAAPGNDLEKYKIGIPVERTPWPVEGVRRASVNCFGFGGTIAHVIVEGFDGGERETVAVEADGGQEERSNDSGTTSESDSGTTNPVLLVWSSPEQGGAQRNMAATATYLENNNNIKDPQQDLSNLAYTLASRRTTFAWRSFAVGHDRLEIANELQERPVKAMQALESFRLAFIFTGQGAQWAGMGVDLCVYPVFRRHLEDASAYLSSLGAEWDVLVELGKIGEESRINEVELSQTLCTVLQTALVDLLRSWNVLPNAVVGHSSGEIAAAYAAGFVGREDAWRLAFFRGRISTKASVGAMIAVGLSVKDVEGFLANGRDVQIACVNSPRNVTLSGTEQGVQILHEVLEKDGVFNRVLNVRVAYHSKYMQDLAADYLALIKDVTILAGSEECLLFSTVTGQRINSSELKPSYFVDNLLSPVRFSEALTSLYKTSSPDGLIEIGPHSALQSAIKDTISSTASVIPLYVSTLSRGQRSITTLLRATGNLWARGYLLNLTAINNPTNSPVTCLTKLPPYAWNHHRTYWFESPRSRAQRLRKFPRTDLLGAPDVASTNISMCWRNFLSTKELPWLLDHQVQGVTLYPAAGMLIMAVEAARQIEADAGDVEGFRLSDVRIERAMVVPEGGFGLETLFTLNGKGRKDCYEFVICSRRGEEGWQENCRGMMVVCRKIVDEDNETSASKEGESTRKSETSPPQNNTRALYQTMASQGMHWGPSFQNLTNIQHTTSSHRSFTVQIPNTAKLMPGEHEYPHLIHPATLDAMFHSIVFAEAQQDRAPKVPNSIGQVYISNSIPCVPGTVLTGTAETREVGLRSIAGKVVVAGPGGTDPLVVIDDLICADIGSADAGDGNDGSRRTLCTRNVWREDVGLLTAEQWGQVKGYQSSLAKAIVLASFKDPGTRMLVVCEDGPEVREEIVSALKSVVEEGLVVAQIIFAGINAGEKEEFREQIARYGSACSVREFDVMKPASDQGFEASSYDVVFLHGQHPDELQADLQTLVRAGGRFISGAASVESELEGQLEKPLAGLIIVRAGKSSSFESLLEPLTQKLSSTFDCKVKTIRELEAGDTSGKIVLVLADLERNGVADWSAQEYEALRRVLLRNKRLLWLTRGATTMNGGNPGAASIMGLLRSLRFEDSSLKLYSLDLAADTSSDESYTIDNVTRILHKIAHSDSYLLEYEFAESECKIHIPRVLPEDNMSSAITNTLERRTSQQALKSLDSDFEAIVEHPGSLESIRFIETEAAQDLPDDHVQIRVMATAVRRSDALTALGQTNKITLGASAAGIITKIGKDVDDSLLGTRVAVTQQGCVRSHVACAAGDTHLFLEGMSFQQAAVATWDYATAYYALCELAKLGWSEKCLILDPCSALGQGAVQIAKYSGAEVFVAASDSKSRAFAKDVLGVALENIIDPKSRIGSLQDDSLHWDVVLCTEGRDEYASCWRSMKDFGRLLCVVEGSIQESNRSEHLARHPSASFITVNAALVQDKRPRIWQRSLEEVFLLLREGSIRPPENATAFRFSQISDAFKRAADTDNTELVVLEAKDDDVVSIVKQEKHPLHAHIRPDATYLMVGGLGGLGRSIATMLVANGAKHIVFASRSGADEDAKVFLSSLRKQGATNAIAVSCDIADATQLQRLLATDLASLPPIRGVINAAMVLRDQLFENMSHSDFLAVLRPKVQGSWNLHAHLPHDLDFFILLSSIAGVGGMRGQTAYAAANAFLDALAHERRRQNHPATAIDLTVVLGVGVVAENPELLEGLHQAGVLTIRESELHRLLKAAITGFSLGEHTTPAQVIVGVASGGHLDRHDIQDSMWPNDDRFKHTLCLGRENNLEHSAASGGNTTRLDALLGAARDLTEASDAILTALVERLAKALSVPAEEIEASRCVSDYGVDSLLAVELRNWIQRRARATVSIFDLMSPMPIRVLAGKIARESGFVKEAVKVDG